MAWRYAVRGGGAGRGRFGDAGRVAWCAWRDEGRDEGRAVFVSSIWSFPCFYPFSVGFSGSFRPSPPWKNIPRRIGAE